MFNRLHTSFSLIIWAIITAMSFSACTDREEIDIDYDTKIVVGASHIFEKFTPVFTEDFEMGSYGTNWLLGLHLFIYDGNGVLIDSKEGNGAELNFKLSHQIKLSPGNYKVVAVAEFHISAGNGDDFWSISGKETLRDLKIKESDSVLSVAQGTLGLYTGNLNISDKSKTIEIDIPAVTALLVNHTWLGDYIQPGDKGFSRFAPYVQKTKIYAENLSQSISFNDLTPVFDNGNIGYRYVINNTDPKNQYRLNLNPRIAGYRALLPQNDQSYYWQLTFTANGGQQFGYAEDVLKSNNTSFINVKSGKQYYTDLILDIMTLTFGEYNPSVDDERRVMNIIEEYKANSKINGAAQIDVTSPAPDPDDDEDYSSVNIADALAPDFDKWMHLSESEITKKLEGYSLFSEEAKTTTYWGKGLVNFITVRYSDNSKTSVNRIMLTWNMENKTQYDKVTAYMQTKYTFFRDEGAYIQFINGSQVSDSSCGITWDSSNYCMYFDAL